MQNRSAVVLSMGMLLEKVDTSYFIKYVLQAAKAEHADFVFTPNLQKEAFSLSATFNQGGITPDQFKESLLRLLNITTIEDQVFWTEWNKIVTVGKVGENFQLLDEKSKNQNALFYLSSDTNAAHFEKIAKESAEQKVNIDMTNQPVLFNQVPLYASCLIKKNRLDLIKHIVNEIQSKTFNKPETITLLLGDPDNIADKTQQAIAKREYDTISDWCQKNNVPLFLHNNALSETLSRLFSQKKVITSEDSEKLKFS